MTPQFPGSSPRYIQFLHDCLQACNAGHAHEYSSTSVLDRDPMKRPAYLIDVVQSCIVDVGELSTDSPNTQGQRYLALSYVWPKDPQDRLLRLQVATLDTFKEVGFLQEPKFYEQIPAVIHHAIAVTAKLGERYLWVDRFCIVQDDPNIHIQISYMDGIYGDAYVIIVAAAPHGKFQENMQATEWPMFEMRQYNDFGPMGRTLDICKALRNSDWSYRGWTYQENIFSQRLAIFTHRGVYWECKGDVGKGALWDGIMLFPGDEGTPLNSHGSSRLTLRKWWPDLETYITLVSEYCGRAFTCPEDGLRGISATLRVMSPSFPDGFIAGLPVMFLDYALLWQPTNCTEPRLLTRQDGITAERSTVLPTWSWCGWPCNIEPGGLAIGLFHVDRWIHRRNVGSWAIRSITRWKALDMSTPLGQEIYGWTSEQLSNVAEQGTGWERHETLEGNKGDSTHFTFRDYESPRFRVPIPLADPEQKSLIDPVPSHLFASTWRATINTAAIIQPLYEAEEDLLCPVLVLRQPSGAFAGLIRMMNKQRPMESTVDLIALSAGSSMAKDFINQREFCAYQRTSRSSLLCPIGDKALGPSELMTIFEDLDTQKPEQISADASEAKSELHEDYVQKHEAGKTPDDYLCKFYNVLWVEEVDGICYRRGCGWVPERVWEANATKCDVTLG